MSIFRVEKNANYTVISNYHLRDKNLSLKTIGLLSLILSLPENWDYSQAGLAAICKDGEDSIRSGLKELEKYGYLERERERDENGHMRGIIYRIYEIPKDKHCNESNLASKIKSESKASKKSQRRNYPLNSDSPKQENPMLVNPGLGLPSTEEPELAEDVEIIKDKPIKDRLNINQSINQDKLNSRAPIDGLTDLTYAATKETICENIGYELLVYKRQKLDAQFDRGEINLQEYEQETLTYDTKKLEQVIGYMLDIITSINDDPIKIGNDLIARKLVKSKLMKVDIASIKRVLFALNTNPTIKNQKMYAISMLYNS